MRTTIARLFCRGSAIALLLATLTVVFVLGVGPILRAHQTSERVMAHQSQATQQALAAAAAARQSRDRLLELVDQYTSGGIYQVGETEAIAAANLLDRVDGIIRAHGATMTAARPSSLEDENGLTRVSLSIVLNASLAAAFHILYALEAERPFTFVEKLEANVLRATGRQDQTSGDDLLSIRLEVYGYIRPVIL